MAAVIEVNGICKSYTLAHEQRERYTALRDVVARRAKKIFSFPKSLRFNEHVTKEEFWALKNVDFSVEEGERIGIIGRNGAGKSTLLKIISRITEPTKGRIKISGRVASLLEVGTGFHPELSGRENIFLNGAIMGMNRAEIRKHFDAIVDFAEVERFLDTPVKRYSSGMYVRLAFAVAAHLEPEILIVDEVLAVGDAQFQRKCLGKMEDVSTKDGRTILFVSHNMGVVSHLCSKGMLLKNGSVDFVGNVSDCIDLYLSDAERNNTIEKPLSDSNQFVKVFNADSLLAAKAEFKFNEEIYLFVQLRIPNWSASLELAISLYDKHKRRIFTIHEPLEKFYKGDFDLTFKIKIPSEFLTPGVYSWLMCIIDPGKTLYDLQDDVCSFSVLETGSSFATYQGQDYGCVFVKHTISLIEP